jgi:hypothetical protein
MRKLTLALSATIVILFAGLVSAQPLSKLTKEEQLAAPCFRLSTQSEFEAAEKLASTTIQLPKRSADGPVWLQPHTKADFSDNPSKDPVHGISLRGAATYADTQPGLLLRCVIRAGEKNPVEIVKYYATTGVLSQIEKKGFGAKDAAFVYFFIPDEAYNGNIQSIDVTAISRGHIKYVGSINWITGN